MIVINKQDRGSGKTSAIISLMTKNEKTACLAFNSCAKMFEYPASLKSRVYVPCEEDRIKDFVYDLRRNKIEILYIDELFVYTKEYLDKLFKLLQRVNIEVIVYTS